MDNTAFPSPHTSHAHVSYPFPNTSSGPRKPLISYIKNDWQHNARRHHARGPSDPSDPQDMFSPAFAGYLRSRAFRRWAALYLILLTLGWAAWVYHLAPDLEYRNLLRESLTARRFNRGGWFGANVRVGFEGLRQVVELDRGLVPGSGVPDAKGRRLVIVGDVHGCVDERE